MARRKSGRSVAQLVTDFGGSLPAAAAEEQKTSRREEYELLKPKAPGRGHSRVGYGWSPVHSPLVPYRASTAEIGGVFPLIAAAGLPPTGALIGYDVLSGGGFYCDPIGWVLADPAIVTNPNLVFFGKPGRGKSTGVKAFATRMMAFGARVLISGDVKGEYEPLCRALGTEPISLGIGLPARINPLDLGPLGHRWASLDADEQKLRAKTIFSRWVTLLRALIGARGVHVKPSDENALAIILADLTGWNRGNSTLAPVTIPQVWQRLRAPGAELAKTCRYDSEQAMLDDTRQAVDALGSLVDGALAGLFDQHTTINLDWGAPIQSLSLQRLDRLGDEALAVALTCLNSWTRGQTDLRRPGEITIVIRDEVWRQMRLGIGAVQSLDADLRLSRTGGQIQILVAHKPSDMLSVGAAGSQEVAIAKDLMSLCDTKVLYGQDPNIAAELAELLDLPHIVQDWVSGWAMQRVGRAVWLIGDRTMKVQTVQAPAERALFDTNNALRPEPVESTATPVNTARPAPAPTPSASTAPASPATAPTADPVLAAPTHQDEPVVAAPRREPADLPMPPLQPQWNRR